MTVFLVTGGLEHSGYDVVYVASSKELADKFIEVNRDDLEESFDFVAIEEFEINKLYG